MPQSPFDAERLIREEAAALGIRPELALQIARQESGVNQSRVSPKGAIGTMQLMPGTAKDLGVNPHDPSENIKGGLRYFKQQMDRFGNDETKALAAYNAGPATVARVGGVPNYPETKNYVQSIQQAAPPPGPPVDLSTLKKVSPAPSAPAAQTAAAPPAPPVDLGSLRKVTPAPSVTTEATNTLLETQPGVKAAGGAEQVRQSLGAAAGKTAEAVGGVAKEFVHGLDPRTPEGQINLAATILSGGASTLVSKPLWKMGMSTLGSVVGGGGAAAAQSMVGTAPPLTTPEGRARVGEQAVGQGLYDVAGQAFMWPIRLAARNVLGPRVARHAAEGLNERRLAITTNLQRLLDQGSIAMRDLSLLTKQRVEGAMATVRGARQQMAGAVSGARATVRGEKQQLAGAVAADKDVIRTTQETLQRDLEAARNARTQTLTGLETQFGQQRVGQPPPRVAGQQVIEILRGPAQTVRDQMGQAIKQVAAEGPDVDITALKAEAQRIFDTEIRPPAEAFPSVAVDPEAAAAAVPTGQANLNQTFPDTPFGRKSAALQASAEAVRQEASRKAADEAIEAKSKAVLSHPAMGVLGKILNAEDTVPFAAAHEFKEQLDNAIGSAWEASVKNQVTNISKHARNLLRGAMDYEPYNAATAAYREIIPLFTKGVAPKLRKQALESPEAVVTLLRGNQPTKARLLRDMLVGLPEEAGQGAEGRRAWDTLRAAWTDRHLLTGSLDALPARLDKLDPEFASILYGDASGQQVMANLRQVADAYQQANRQTLANIADVRRTGRARVSAAETKLAGTQAQGRQAIAGAQTALAGTQAHGGRAVAGAEQLVAAERLSGAQQMAVEQGRQQTLKQQRFQHQFPTAEEEAFKASSLSGRTKTSVAAAEADVARVAMQSPTNPWWVTSMLRLLNGPKGKDIIRWSVYSPTGTRLLSEALVGPMPGQAVSALLREMNLTTDDLMDPSSRQGQPPPGPGPSETPTSPSGRAIGPGRAGGPGPKQGASLTVGQPPPSR